MIIHCTLSPIAFVQAFLVIAIELPIIEKSIATAICGGIEIESLRQ